MEHLTAPPNAVVPGERFGTPVPLFCARRRAGTADPDAESNTKRPRIASRIPGARERAPRRNALIALAYLIWFALLVGLFGRLLGLVPA